MHSCQCQLELFGSPPAAGPSKNHHYSPIMQFLPNDYIIRGLVFTFTHSTILAVEGNDGVESN